ncbi:transglycosylase domain-containing protein [Cytophagales bacterium LB-30]|uniref:Transglycosylase domain-containing protein n=1 Tax=Shiella aurantiaca TaxID=3058365 RepID=A0ABT8F6Y6_9BACT|nr:transglycosylase domain-containing protein [Shiella aurantiaca]MDN4166145.1 transglycosylase domain-containing protein [Shiella aurantiaca]
MTAPKKSTSIYKKIGISLWIVFLSFIILFPLYIYSVSINFLNLYGDLPSYSALENPENDLSSELYSADGVLLGKYFRENRSQITYEDLSPNLINALIATEDYRFEKHSGIDLRSLFRVFFRSLLLGQDAGGGSTLTQQIAKNLFKTRESDGLLSDVPVIKMVIIKTKEWIVAVQLEKSYTKKELLAMYLNTADFGSNAYGVKVAAKTYFNKGVDSLNIQEAAMLSGMLQAPSRYNPSRNPETALFRRNTVLGQLKKYGFLTTAEFDSIKALPIELEYKVENHNQGLATYFRSVIKWFLLDWSKQHGYDLYESGLRIYTTIDSRMQRYAEEAVNEHMGALQKLFDEHWAGQNPWIDDNGKEIKNFIEDQAKKTDRYKSLVAHYGEDSDSVDIIMNKAIPMKVFSWEGEKDTLMSPLDSLRYYKKFLHAGFMAMDPHTGHIKAWVGGINHKYFKYDHVKQGRRQPGSTFKPIVYAAAIDNGYTPCYEVIDAPVTFPRPGQNPPSWTPSNFSGVFTGEKMTIRQAMAKSVNSITAYIMKKIGPETVVDYAKRMGIESPLDPVPALCLGTSDVSIYELIGAYSTFVNKGFWTEPFYITRIEDKNGNVLQEFFPKTGEALSEETAYLMTYMLRGATEEWGGTALGLSRELRSDNQIGAKTGTTQNASDGWFVGITEQLSAGIWVGGDERTIHFKDRSLGQGARMALPAYEKFMRKVYADKDLGYVKQPFKEPLKPLSTQLDCSKYAGNTLEADSLNTMEAFDENEIF